MKTVEEYFSDSISRYELLVKEANALASDLQSLAPEKILERCSHLQVLQQEIADNDAHIVEVMNFVGPDILDNPSTGEYQRAIQKAIEATDNVLLRTKSMRSFLLSEIGKLRTNMKGIGKYSSGIKHKGDIIRSEA